MSLWAHWATQRTPLITSDIQRDSLFHLAISFRSDTEQEIRCLLRMLLRMVLLNTGFTKAEEPNYLWSPEKKSSSSKWRAISWGRGAIKTLPSRERAKFQAWSTKEATGPQYTEGSSDRGSYYRKLSREFDYGHSCFSFKMGQLLVSIMYEWKSNPFNFAIAWYREGPETRLLEKHVTPSWLLHDGLRCPLSSCCPLRHILFIKHVW